jgi:hypothetical protein
VALLVLVKSGGWASQHVLIALTELLGDMGGKERPYYLASHTLPLSHFQVDAIANVALVGANA